MPKASTSAGSLQKISNALEALKNELSYKEYRKWNCREFPRRFAISTTFSTVLRNLRAIQVNPEQRGEYRLTDKMASLRPTTVRNHINQYQAESRTENKPSHRKRRAYTRTVPAVQPELFSAQVTNKPSFETILIALKEQVRQEVMNELYEALSK
jgi:hypothetical protein